MPQSDRDSHSASNVVDIRMSEAENVLFEIRALRQRILVAWQERGVLLSADERADLKAEIAYTCELLTVLTKSD